MLGIAVSPDGVLLATASSDSTTRIWDLATGTTRTILQGHTASVLDVAFSPGGNLLATASSDGTVRIWDVTAGAALVTLIAQSGSDYATLLADGYKLGGDPDHDLWWVIKLCRFAPGELDDYVPGLRRLPADTPILVAGTGTTDRSG